MDGIPGRIGTKQHIPRNRFGGSLTRVLLQASAMAPKGDTRKVTKVDTMGFRPRQNYRGAASS